VTSRHVQGGCDAFMGVMRYQLYTTLRKVLMYCNELNEKKTKCGFWYEVMVMVRQVRLLGDCLVEGVTRRWLKPKT